MSGLEQRVPERPASSDVPQLIDDYRRQQDALRKQTDDLSHLLERVLAAADRESKEILKEAQAGIRRVLLGARRDLLELGAQIESLRKTHQRLGDPRFDEALDRAATTVAERRHALHELLRDARADLTDVEPAVPDAAAAIDSEKDELPHPLFAPIAPSRPAVSAPPPPQPVRPIAVGPQAVRPQPAPPPVFVAPPIVDAPLVPPSPRATLVANKALAAFVAAGVIVVAATTWWVRGGSGSASRQAATPDRKADGGRIAGNIQLPADPAAASHIALPGTPLAVTVTAQRRVWVRASADGKNDEGRFMDAGTSRSIVATKDVSVRAGDAGAVKVSVNGGAPEPLGRDGETVTRQFAAASAGSTPAAKSGDVAAATSTAAPAPAALGATAPAPKAAGTAGTSAAAAGEPPDLAARVDQWMEAYTRRDAAAFGALSTRDASISDNRRQDERGVATARHTFEGLHVQLVGDQAVLSGKLIEIDPSGRTARRASWISQMWTRQNGAWLLMDARIRAESRPE